MKYRLTQNIKNSDLKKKELVVITTTNPPIN